MENWTVKSVDGNENLSTAEREEAVLEQANIDAPETAPQEEQGYQTPTNDDGDFVVNLDNPPNLEEDAIQEREATEISLEPETGDSGEVVEEVREQPEQEAVQPVEDAGFEVEKVSEEEPVEEKVEEPVAIHNETPKIEVPENLQNLVDFMNDTGGTLEDFVNLNRDVTQMDPVQTIREYYKQKYPHYDDARIDRRMNKDFAYDQEMDEPDVIQDKIDAFNDELYNAQQFLTEKKEKYYADLKSAPRNLDPQINEAVKHYQEYQAQEEAREQQLDRFYKLTDDVFNEDFKGFDFKVGDNKFRVKVGDTNKIANTQKDITNFVKQFVDDDSGVKDVANYHKALYVASNADKFAQHFYEQGRADAIKQSAAQAKNIDMKPRQDAASVVTPSGTKFKVVGGQSSNGLKIKMRN